MIESSTLLVAALFMPVIAAGLANLFGTNRYLRDISVVVAGIGLCALVAELGQRILLGEAIDISLFEIIPGIPVSFRVEPLGMIYAGVASLLFVVTVIYSSGYLKKTGDGAQTKFFIYLCLSISMALAIAFSANLITMFIFYELLTLFTYPLVTHKGDYKSVVAGRKYLGYLIGTSIALFLPAIIFIYNATGNIQFTDGGVFNTPLSNHAQVALLMAFLYGIGKSAVMPLHSWLPSAMAAPTPVSALLHAVAVVKAGIFCFAKIIVYIFGTEALRLDVTQYISYIAAGTIIIASVVAVFQDNLKLRLAYSTIAQLSYAILAVSLLNPSAVSAAGMQIAGHAVAKITLFFVAGAIIIVAGVSRVSELNGAGRRMPLTMLCFFICSLSLMGAPYLAGGEVKHMLSQGAAAAKIGWVEYVLYASALLNAIYLLPVSFRAFFRKPQSKAKLTVPVSMVAAIIFTTLLTVTFSMYNHIIIELTERL